MPSLPDLTAAMIERCEDLIQRSLREEPLDRGLSVSIRPAHLLSMCDAIRADGSSWPVSKVHRWLGFVQCGMIANDIVDLDGAKAMFDEAKKMYPPDDSDRDLVDHLDPESAFRLELGGEA